MTTEPADATIQEEAKSSSKDLSFRLKAGAFLATAAGIGMLGGFGAAVAATNLTWRRCRSGCRSSST